MDTENSGGTTDGDDNVFVVEGIKETRIDCLNNFMPSGTLLHPHGSNLPMSFPVMQSSLADGNNILTDADKISNCAKSAVPMSCLRVMAEDQSPLLPSEIVPVPRCTRLMNFSASLVMKCNFRGLLISIRKELSKSDVRNRIVLPKKDAECYLPVLTNKGGMEVHMDDMLLSNVTWKFSYRFWANNMGRMYILDNTGDFVKAHDLRTGDIITIYRSRTYGNYFIKGERSPRLAQVTGPHASEKECSSHRSAFRLWRNT